MYGEKVESFNHDYVETESVIFKQLLNKVGPLVAELAEVVKNHPEHFTSEWSRWMNDKAKGFDVVIQIAWYTWESHFICVYCRGHIL